MGAILSYFCETPRREPEVGACDPVAPGRCMAVGRTLLALSLFVMAPFGLASAQDAARGEALFRLCGQCHGPEAGGNPLFGAPAIAGMSQWYVEAQLGKFRSGLRGLHPDDLMGLRMGPMSKWLASEEDVKTVAAYVASLPPTSPARSVEGGDPATGKVLYATCAACHGVNGEGNQQLNGPALTHIDDWYILDQLKKYKEGVRGGDTRDLSGILMRPMAIALAGDQAMKDVVAHIMTLSD